MELFQPMHLLIVVGLLVLFFGGRKLPELGKGMGEGLRSFKEGLKGVTEETPVVKTESKPEEPAAKV